MTRKQQLEQRIEELEEVLTWIASPSYIGNYAPMEVVEIHRKWAKSALEKGKHYART
jgi:hypothetical protein